MNKKVMAGGCVLWIAGLAAAIIGLNIPGSTGQWLTTVGSIAFFIGLLTVGAVKFAKKKQEEEEKNSDP